jgi:hypothetical protein
MPLEYKELVFWIGEEDREERKKEKEGNYCHLGLIKVDLTLS